MSRLTLFLSKKKGIILLGSFLTFILLVIFIFKYCGTPNYITLSNFHHIDKDFTLIDENGKKITIEDLKGNILLVNYLSTSCPYDCPMSFGFFKLYIYNELVENEGFEDVKIISFFLDTIENATKKIIDFRNYHQIDPDKWLFVKEKDQANPFFNVGLSQGNPWEKKDTIFGYDKEAYVMTMLVDKEFNIRGKYLNKKDSQIRRITKEISLLIKEEK